MYWMFYLAAAAVLVLLFLIGFITPSDLMGNMNWKQWVQAMGGGIMLGSIYHRGFHFNQKGFAVGALIFASSFLTWKRSKNSGNSRESDD
jgi:hypothetical protein